MVKKDLFKDILPSIMVNKKDILNDENDYVPYVVNKALSFHYDCIMYSNRMNMLPNCDRRLQYHYYLNTIRPYKRSFQKWQKRETIDNLAVVKEYYKYSNEKAKEVLNVLTDDHINEIRKRIDKGGLNVRPKRTNRGDVSGT